MSPAHRIATSAVLTAALLCVLSLLDSADNREQVPKPGKQEPTASALERIPAPHPAKVVFASAAVPDARSTSEAPPSEFPHPHPLTPQHERIYRENKLTFALDGAVEVEDVAGIRRLLSIYRQEFPEDSLVLQQGYELIADCLERPGAKTRAAAQRFYDTELASALRRHVRRHCLE